MSVPFAYLHIPCLVVDDENSMRLTIRNMMAKIGFRTIFIAENGKRALEIIKASKIELVVTDVNMPEMNGLELFKKVKDDKKLNHITFLFITAEARRDIVARVAEAGSGDYIIKPFVMATLEDKLGALLTKRFNPSPVEEAVANFKKYMEERDLEKAEKEIEKAIMLAPDNATITFYMAQLELAKGDAHTAIELFREAIAKKPMFVKAHNSLGELYESLGDVDSAVKHYEMAHRISPANTERLITLSKIYCKTGRIEKAEDLLKNARDEMKGDLGSSNLLLGELYLNQNENEKALNMFQQAQKSNPSDISILLGLAEAHRRLGGSQNAINLYRQVLKSNPNNALVYHSLGKTFIEAGDRAQAIEAITKAWEINPFSKDIIADLKSLAEKSRLKI